VQPVLVVALFWLAKTIQVENRKMRPKTPLSIGLGLIAVIVTACTDAPTSPKDSFDQVTISDLVGRGFPAGLIVDAGDRFIIDGDIVVLKASRLSSAPAQANGKNNPGVLQPRMQWLNSGGKANVNVIHVDLSPLGGSDWGTAAAAAMQDWSTIQGVNLSMDQSAPADIVVSEPTNYIQYCQLGSIACAEFPVDGHPGGHVWINHDYDNTYTVNQKRFLLVHELGHTLGFRHSNWRQLGEQANSTSQIFGTPPTDGASVMNGQTGGNNWVGFSYYDVVAASYLYRFYFDVTYFPSDSHISWSDQGASSYHGYYFRNVPAYDQEGRPYYIGYTDDLGYTTGTSFNLTDGDTGDASCGNQVQIDALLTNGATMTGLVMDPPGITTCYPWP
jgi:hypothetical protein